MDENTLRTLHVSGTSSANWKALQQSAYLRQLVIIAEQQMR